MAHTLREVDHHLWASKAEYGQQTAGELEIRRQAIDHLVK